MIITVLIVMIGFISRLFAGLFGKKNAELAKKASEKVEKQANFDEIKEIHSIWDYLKFKEGSQAKHLADVIGFEEWVAMEEVRRRIKEIYGIDYNNERSLYPYLKALTDANLFETSDVGGKRKWRKKDLYITIKSKIRKKEAVEEKEKAKETEKELNSAETVKN